MNEKRGGHFTRVTKVAKTVRNPVLPTNGQNIAIASSNYSRDAK